MEGISSMDSEVLPPVPILNEDEESDKRADDCDGTEPPPCKFPRLPKEPIPEGMSKKQYKKMKSREKYMEKRKHKRVEEKARKKAKREQMKADGKGHELLKPKWTRMNQSNCKIRIAVDMSFDDKMIDKDQKRTVLQLAWCYAANRRAENPLQYHVVGFSGACKKYFDSTYSKWDVNIHEKPLEETFQKEEVVYLTADSENVIDKLEESKVYVIGGIIDHNSEKFLCYNIAKERGYQHARLPIDEFVNMKTRKVLTINHVFEILLKYSESGDWEKAFFTVIPQRKGVQKKDQETEEQCLSESDESSVENLETAEAEDEEKTEEKESV